MHFYRVYSEAITNLIKSGVLSSYKAGNFSVCAKIKIVDSNGNKYSVSERIDPSCNGEFYCFHQEEDTQNYMNETRAISKKKLFIHEWPQNKLVRLLCQST